MEWPWKKTAIISLLPLAALPSAVWASSISYLVEFEGLNDPIALRSLKESSQLVALRKKEPFSVNALRFRAESDASDLKRVLKAYGYFEGTIEPKIEYVGKDYLVILSVNPGPLYRVEQVSLHFYPKGARSVAPPISADEIGIGPTDPADIREIERAEICALELLSERGYPLAKVTNREIVADGKSKRVKIDLQIDLGPFSRFGSYSIVGNTSVRSSWIEQQIQWEEGDPYNSALVSGTQASLIDTGLFTSVYITHAESLNQEGALPMKIEVAESKHRTISLGLSYQTTYGPGGTLGWEHRNINGLGRKLSLQADIAQRRHSGMITYLIPNFYRLDQNYIIQGQIAHESITPYEMQSYSFLNRFDSQFDPCLFFSIGPKLEYLKVKGSVDDGNFLLFEGPILVRWTNVEDFLNPCSGIRFEYRGVPTLNIKDTSDFYYSQVLIFSSYLPFAEGKIVLAQKVTLGTIFSNGTQAVPVPKRFFGGSEENLRGYKYSTVSPLNKKGGLKGGRSAIYYSLEPRLRVTKAIGIIPFFDLGKVYPNSFPNFKRKWLKSVGIGVRYCSFVGPLRIDVAFPINRRKGLDPSWWTLVNIGQAF